MPLSLALVKQKYSSYGGAEKIISAAVKALDQNDDIRVSILARSWKLEPGLASANFQTIRCNPPYIGRAMRDKTFAFSVSRHLNKFDLVQAHEPLPGAHIYRAGSGLHVQWLQQMTRDLSEGEKQKIFKANKHKTPINLERKMLEHQSLKAVIAISPMVVKNIAETYPDFDHSKVRLIWNGVDHQVFSPSSRGRRRSESRSKFAILDSQKALLMLGSGWHRKGVMNALAFLTKLPRDVILLVAGKESNMSPYKEAALSLGLDSMRLRWVGATSDPAELYAAADLFVFPSLYDQFGNAALEAMACGLPVVVSSTSGVCALVSDGINGFVRNWWEPLEWVDPIMACLERSEAMGECSYEVSMAFTFERMVKDWSNLYRDVLPCS